MALAALPQNPEIGPIQVRGLDNLRSILSLTDERVAYYFCESQPVKSISRCRSRDGVRNGSRTVRRELRRTWQIEMFPLYILSR